MKRFYFIGFVLALFLAFPGLATGAGEQGHPANGTWVVTVPTGPETSYDILLTVDPDGTLLFSQGTNEFVGGYTQASTRQGVWEKDGPRTLIGTHVGFMFDGDGEFVAYLRYRWWAEIPKEDPDTAIATLLVDVYSDGSDGLLDPNSDPDATEGPVVVTARRVPVIPPF